MREINRKSQKARGAIEAAFSAQLYTAMNWRRMSSSEVAKAVGISPGAVRSYLNGKYLPRPKFLRLLEESLEVRFIIGDPNVIEPQMITTLNNTIKVVPSETESFVDKPPQSPVKLTISQSEQMLTHILGLQVEINSCL